MNETIVSPWVIYLIMESKNIGAIILIVSCVTASLFWKMYSHTDARYKHFLHKTPHTEVEVEMRKNGIRHYRLLSWIFGFSCLICVILAIATLFIPSRDTLIMLYLNQFVTPENLDEAMKIINSMK
jgi:hypothetical protein